MPLPDTAGSSITLDTGQWSTSAYEGDLQYKRDSTTGQPVLDLTNTYNVAWSTDVAAPNPGQADCAGAVSRAPRAHPITDFSTQLNVCVRTTGRGIALVKLTNAPIADGTLTLQETYWPAS